MENYYDILGVEKNASKDDIKKAYRKLAHKFHPDKQGGDPERFKRATEAYAVLSDEKRRAEYDTYGRVFSGAGSGAGGFDWGDLGVDFGNARDFRFDVGDIFEQFFGASAGPARSRARGERGNDIFIDLEIPFEHSIFGTKRTVVIGKLALCDRCGGSKAEPGTHMEKCKMCNGSGQTHETRKSFFGTFSATRACRGCAATGEVPKEPCGRCGGKGVLKRSEEVTIQIPSGIESGEMIKIPGMGEAVAAPGVPGDLYAKIRVEPHATLTRDGYSLRRSLDVKLSDAILGATVEVETLDGKANLKVPSGAESGEMLRITGKGVPRGRRGERGDLLITLNVKTPKRVSGRAKDLVEELRREGF